MKHKLIIFSTLAVTVVSVAITQNFMLLALAVVAFIQNMAFTASSRSRNSANPSMHFWVATVSNGVWFICNFFLILPDMMKIINNGDWVGKFCVMATYIAWTSYGSVVMMEYMLKKEKGKNKVGASKS